MQIEIEENYRTIIIGFVKNFRVETYLGKPQIRINLEDGTSTVHKPISIFTIKTIFKESNDEE